MSRQLARKQPTGLTLPRTEVMTAPLHRKNDLLVQLNGMVKRREIGAAYTMIRVQSGWAVKIVRIREAPGWFERNWLKLTIVTCGASALIGAVAFLVRILVSAVVGLFASIVPIGIGAVVVLAVLRLAGGGRVIEVIQKVKIRG